MLSALEVCYENALSKFTFDIDIEDGSLRPPDVRITGHVPSSICIKLDIDLQLDDVPFPLTSDTFKSHCVLFDDILVTH